jgi:hypothetical protein
MQYVMTPQEAFDNFAEGLGVAIIPKLSISRFRMSGMTVHALSEASLSFETALMMRGENDSRWRMCGKSAASRTGRKRFFACDCRRGESI